MSTAISRDTGIKPRIRIGQDVVILQSAKPGRVRGQMRHDGQPWMYRVRYVTDIGALCTEWLPSADLALIPDTGAKALAEGHAAADAALRDLER